ARISGKLDLGTFFSGSGGVATRTFNVNDTALFNLNPDLIVSANVSGVSNVSLTKAGSGTLLVRGSKTDQDATRTTAGFLAGGINEGNGLFPGSGLTKTGRGELNIAGAATFTGTLNVGSTSNNQDGGTLRFSGAAGALLKNFNTINVGVNSSLILDNAAANN